MTRLRGPFGSYTHPQGSLRFVLLRLLRRCFGSVLPQSQRWLDGAFFSASISSQNCFAAVAASCLLLTMNEASDVLPKTGTFLSSSDTKFARPRCPTYLSHPWCADRMLPPV